jgi:hypothetical protein
MPIYKHATTKAWKRERYSKLKLWSWMSRELSFPRLSSREH